MMSVGLCGLLFCKRLSVTRIAPPLTLRPWKQRKHGNKTDILTPFRYQTTEKLKLCEHTGRDAPPPAHQTTSTFTTLLFPDGRVGLLCSHFFLSCNKQVTSSAVHICLIADALPRFLYTPIYDLTPRLPGLRVLSGVVTSPF
ncbi:unnamed protein product [Protopolystoma xenopodis]|uniref:Uncharacterized protein n=1 Tax=Protopolystoma xenopodis TaxID=117903 RepID=A0A448XNZ7_9PLAT|nr:unnamed protein product [Protopolystoma xenopodis]